VLVSRKVVLQRERESEHARQLGTLQPGQVVQGRVTRIEDYGAFVAFGRGMEGLVHVSNLAHERVAHPADVVALGQHLELKVLSIKRSGKRIALGLKQMSASPWADLERRHWIDQIVEGIVTRLCEYGAFVAIHPGVEGLLHVSQTGIRDANHRRAVLARGQRISVRILELDCAGERLSLSLLHKHGARIAPDEALLAGGFEELLRDSEAARTAASSTKGNKLGRIIARALDPGAQSA
jgi:small subunit ribosomal protein S1